MDGTTGTWHHALVGATAACLRELRRGFRSPKVTRQNGRWVVTGGSLVVVGTCALAAWLWDHSLLTAAGIGSLGHTCWELLGRSVTARCGKASSE